MKKAAQAGSSEECGRADVYDAVELGRACSEVFPAPFQQWSLVGNRLSKCAFRH